MLAISPVAQAQSDFEIGFFRLKNGPEVRKRGLLRMGSKNLVVKQYTEGPTIKYPWEEVLSYDVGLRRYIRSSGFTIRRLSGWGHETANNEFVELLDSGAVSILHYVKNIGAGTYSSVDEIILLQRAGEQNPTAIPYSVFESGGKQFREALSPFVSERPDLVALLSTKKITIRNLRTFIHAFNQKEPFLDYPMQGPVPSPKLVK